MGLEQKLSASRPNSRNVALLSRTKNHVALRRRFTGATYECPEVTIAKQFFAQHLAAESVI